MRAPIPPLRAGAGGGVAAVVVVVVVLTGGGGWGAVGAVTHSLLDNHHTFISFFGRCHFFFPAAGTTASSALSLSVPEPLPLLAATTTAGDISPCSYF